MMVSTGARRMRVSGRMEMMTTDEQALTQAPAVTLKANGHGRMLTFNELGVPAVLVCVARETSNLASPVVNAVREKYATADQVLIVNVADTRPFPRLIRKVAEQIMKSAYNDAVKNLEPGSRPEDYVLIVPDWDGDLLGPLGIDDVSKTIAVVVLDARGGIVGVYQGDDAPAQAVEMLGRL
jgi:hypothetical protein